MHPWLICQTDLSLPRILRQFESTNSELLIIVDEDQRLQGLLQRQALQRALLNENRDIHTLVDWNPPKIHRIDHRIPSYQVGVEGYRHIPVVNSHQQVEAVLEVPDHYWRYRSTPVVIMAGGLGRRLGELTREVPKPMLPLGSKPVLHVMIERLMAHGLGHFYLCVNYRSEVVREYFGDGSNLGVEIHYVEEEQFLGTAGSINLLRDSLTETFVVMNGDLLTTLNFDSLLDVHREKAATATLCVHEYSYQLPFGVIQTQHSRVLALEEKPRHHCYINAGIYVLEPQALSALPSSGYCDMTTVCNNLLAQQASLHAYHINEFWMDIGQVKDYTRMQEIFAEKGLISA